MKTLTFPSVLAHFKNLKKFDKRGYIDIIFYVDKTHKAHYTLIKYR